MKGVIIFIIKILVKEFVLDGIMINCVSLGFIEIDMINEL